MKKSLGFRNRKGNVVLELGTIILVVIVFSITAIVLHAGMTPLYNEINDSSDFSNDTKAITETFSNNYPSIFDSAVLTIFVLLTIFAVISAFAINTRPIFFGISIILVFIVLTLSVLLANVYDDVVSDPAISSTAALFPFTTWIMTHLLEVSIAVVFFIIIALYVGSKIT